MNFFEAQDSARSRSRLLTALFLAAVCGLITTVYLAVRLFGIFYGMPPESGAGWFDPGLFAMVALGTGLLIGGGSAYRVRQLRSGGPVVAAMLGGRRVLSGTGEPAERRLVNVVEEMAIASGVPVPAIYVLDGESSINAFAAGYTIHDAAVAVTRGALETLDRDELQGVIAHEFSHILNGDMRLNIRLVGLLHGILLLAIVGRGLLRSSSGRGSRRGKGGQAALLGLVLMVLGYVGVLFGKLVRAAISREREFLADAAAVQFTRNPGGIGGALKKIGAHGLHSRIESPQAEEVSHLFFAHGLRPHWFSFLATHPPLEERIRRVDPGWDGYFVSPAREPSSAAGPSGAGPAVSGFAATAAVESPATLMASIGSPGPEHLPYAGRLIASVPDELREAARFPESAPALALALLMDGDAGTAKLQGQALDQLAPAWAGTVDRLTPAVRGLPPEARLPLLDLAVPALRELAPEETRRLRAAAHRLVRADEDVHAFEYALVHILARQVAGEGDSVKPGKAVHSFQPLRHEVETVLSALAWSGTADEARARTSFSAAVARLPGGVGEIHLRERALAGLAAVDRALGRIAEASFGIRRRFLDACAHCVAHDGRLGTGEIELLRAIAEALNCPMPPAVAPSTNTAAPAGHPLAGGAQEPIARSPMP